MESLYFLYGCPASKLTDEDNNLKNVEKIRGKLNDTNNISFRKHGEKSASGEKLRSQPIVFRINGHPKYNGPLTGHSLIGHY
jgi:hypothetical protein